MIIILTAAEGGVTATHFMADQSRSLGSSAPAVQSPASLSRQHNNTFPDKLQFQCGMPFNKCHVYSSQLVSKSKLMQ